MEGSLTVLGFVWILFSSSLLEIKAIAPLTCSKCNTGRFFLDSQKRKDTAGYKLANGKRSMQVNIETKPQY
ncbi:unnamed protein product [Porites evermanni]|uniref:Secreted protein n=1 Tax=Porites evermanni TaxID=104178 RepID=A0ABN8T4L9_9CNID|nr:unnamed protein product [Porites evermanni]